MPVLVDQDKPGKTVSAAYDDCVDWSNDLLYAVAKIEERLPPETRTWRTAGVVVVRLDEDNRWAKLQLRMQRAGMAAAFTKSLQSLEEDYQPRRFIEYLMNEQRVLSVGICAFGEE